ncbi:hypothetical protein [Jutongia sp.]|uniref:hypothetical protein n=1 Tax=Jutongia sp. TaxID=2944204 RepID=UPI00307AE61B
MRVLPMLFNTEMVKAILDGRKTCTRRVLKHPFEVHPNGFITKPHGNDRLCPYTPPYQPGDILYVRETWSEIRNADGSHKKYVYKASDQYPFGESGYIIKFKWKPSIHMPKEAARIWLKVTDVRVERLQDITEVGAINEGCIDDIEFAKGKSARNHFAALWNTTIKKPDIDIYGWSANPWVWVIEFERCEKPGKENIND